jgi:hypothetical protein
LLLLICGVEITSSKYTQSLPGGCRGPCGNIRVITSSLLKVDGHPDENTRLMRLNNDEYDQVMDEMLSDMCPGNKCILKILVSRLHPDPRLLLQINCIDRFRETHQKKDWDEAIATWISDGYAESFAIAYSEAELKFLEEHVPPQFEAVYDRIMTLISSQKDTKKGLDFKI